MMPSHSTRGLPKPAAHDFWSPPTARQVVKDGERSSDLKARLEHTSTSNRGVLQGRVPVLGSMRRSSWQEGLDLLYTMCLGQTLWCMSCLSSSSCLLHARSPGSNPRSKSTQFASTRSPRRPRSSTAGCGRCTCCLCASALPSCQTRYPDQLLQGAIPAILLRYQSSS